MNRDLTDADGAGEQRDPVADFFATERADVRELPAGTDRWEGIVAEARRPVRRPWLPYAAGAAAAVVVGTVVWGAATRPGDPVDPATASGSHPVTATVTQTVTPSPTDSPATGGATAPASTSSAPTGPLAVPVSFGMVAMTNGGGGHLRALGSADCPGGKPCVSVVGSDDDGQTWTARATFEKQDAEGQGRATPTGPDELVGLRFATPDIGYAFGGAAWRSDDGGRRFDRFDVGGRRVLSLEVGGDTVWLVTAQACSAEGGTEKRGCRGLEVWNAPVSATRATRVRALETAGAVDDAWLSMDGHDAYVSVSYTDPDTQTLPQQVSGDPRPVARPAGCAEQGGVWAWATANTREGLVAVCRAAKADPAAYAVATSTDSGATWTDAVPAPGLGTPGAGGVWLTAPDLDHFVAVTGGLATTGGTAPATGLVASGDGGRSWARPAGAEDSDQWSWAGAGGGALVYAVRAGAGTYAVSHDSGMSFETVPLRR